MRTSSPGRSREILLLSALAAIAPSAGDARGQDPAPGPDRIVYASMRPQGWDIFQVDPSGGIRQLTTHPSLDYEPDVSPDGRWLVFTSERAGRPDLYALDLREGGEPRLLIESAAMQDQADVSPDGRWLVFVSTHTGDAEIFRLPFRPGETLTLDAAENLTRHPGGDFRPAVSPDGTRLAFSSDRVAPPVRNPRYGFVQTRTGDVHLLDLETRRTQRLTETPGWSGAPAWSPDGGSVLHYAQADDREPGIWSVPVDGGPATRLTPPDSPAMNPAVMPDGRIAWRAWSDDVDGDFRIVAGHDGAAAPLTPPDLACHAPDFDAEGTLYCHGRRRSDSQETSQAQVLEIPGAPHRTDVEGRPVELHPVNTAFAVPPNPVTGEWVWATVPDGPPRDSVTFHFLHPDLTPSRAPIRFSSGGSQPLFAMQPMGVRWSPDGTRVLFSLGAFRSGPPTTASLWMLDVETGEARRVSPGGPWNEAHGDFTPDGRGAVYRSGRDEQWDLRLTDFATGDVFRLTDDTDKETFPSVSPDGDVVVYASNRDGVEIGPLERTFDLYVAPFDGRTLGVPRRITDDPGQDAHARFSWDGEWIVFVSAEGGISDEELQVQTVRFGPQMYGELWAYRLSDGLKIRLTHDKWEDGPAFWLAPGPSGPPAGN